MREIKFRAWDVDTEKWITDNILLEANGELMFQGEYGGQLHDHEIVLQFYTGLKDKNDLTEVYECDIIDIDGKVKGNIYEMDKEKTDLVIQGFGTKTWCKTYNDAILRGCKDSE